MLILTRRIGEVLRIGDEVSVVVMGVNGNQVKLGVDAPKHIAVHREEIYRRIQKEKAPIEDVSHRSCLAANTEANYFPTPPAKDKPLSFYSSDGSAVTRSKTPNVIIKKKNHAPVKTTV